MSEKISLDSSVKSDIFLSDYEFCMVKTEQTVTAKTAMLLQF